MKKNEKVVVGELYRRKPGEGGRGGIVTVEVVSILQKSDCENIVEWRIVSFSGRPNPRSKKGFAIESSFRNHYKREQQFHKKTAMDIFQSAETEQLRKENVELKEQNAELKARLESITALLK